jgi:hypothetical protein
MPRGLLEEVIMRAFLVACLALVAIGVGGYFFLSAVQEPTGIAFATDETRIDRSWVWRSLLGTSDASETGTETVQAEACEKHSTWQWIFIDFGRRDGESGACWASQ